MKTTVTTTIAALLLSGLSYAPEVLAMNPHQAFEARCHVCARLTTATEGKRWARAMHHQTLFDGDNVLRDIYFDNDEYIAIKVNGLSGYSITNDVGWVIIYDPDRAVVSGWSIEASLLNVSATFNNSATSGNKVRLVAIDRLGNKIWEEDQPKGVGPLWQYDPRHPDGHPYTRAESPHWKDPHAGLGHLILRVSVPKDGPQPSCGIFEAQCRLDWAKARGWKCVCNQPDKNLAVCSPPYPSGGNK